MSGIVGVYFLDNRAISPETLQRMNDHLAHRGSDSAGTWHAGPVGFGHRMLWTTRESLRERLPLISDDRQLSLTADARIDNRDELITTLGVNAPADQISDSELILGAYRHWGTNCPEHLLGDFAFAIWDNAQQHLFCARDHMGVKPFYYYHSDNIFAFASEIKALFCLSEVPKKLNETQVAFQLAWVYNREITTYEDILRLPAAHSLTVCKTGIAFRWYWRLDQEREMSLATDEDYEQAFREVFCEAVRCRLRSAFPVGSELSGGLDSSSVACVARTMLEKESGLTDLGEALLHVFYMVFDSAPENDSSAYVNAVLAKGNFVPHWVHCGKGGPLANVDDIFWHADEPLNTWGMAAAWEFYSIVRDAGVRVLLGGEFGDYGGSSTTNCLVELVRRRKLRTVLREVKAYSRNYATPALSVLWSKLIRPLAFDVMPERCVALKRRLRPLKPSTLDYSFLRSDVAQRTGVLGHVHMFKQLDRRQRTDREMQYLNYVDGVNQHVLESYDKLAAAFSIEVRHPYLDRRVIEFFLALPPEQKTRHGYTRAIVRSALRDWLPLEVRTRVDKPLFNPVMNRGLRVYEQSQLEEMIFRNSEPIDNFIDIQKLRNEYFKLNEDEGYELARTWDSMVLWLWLRKSGFQDSGARR